MPERMRPQEVEYSQDEVARNVEEFTKKTSELLDGLKENEALDDREKAMVEAAKKGIKQLTENLDPAENADAYQSFFDAMGMAAQEYGRLPKDERELLALQNPEYVAYRRDAGEALTMVNEYLQYAGEDKNMRAMSLKLIEAYTTGNVNEASLKAQLETDPPLEASQIDQIIRSLQNVADTRPHPFSKFRQQVQQEAGTNTFVSLNKIQRRNARARREIIEVYDTVKGPLDTSRPEGAPHWERMEPLPENKYDGWRRDVRENENRYGEFHVIDTTRGDKLYQEQRVWFRNRQVRAAPPAQRIQRNSAYALRKDEKGKIVEKQVEHVRIELFTSGFLQEIHRNKVQGGNYGDVYTEKSKIVNNVLAFEASYDNIVEVVEGIEQLDHAITKDGGKKWHVPILRPVRQNDGKVKQEKSYVIVDARTYHTWRQQLESSHESFKRAGFDYETEKARRRSRKEQSYMHFVEANRGGSEWLEFARQDIYLRNTYKGQAEKLREARLELDIQDFALEKLAEAQAQMQYIYESFNVNYNNIPRYQHLAERRVLGKGFTRGTHEWNEALEVEVMQVAYEFELQKAVMTEMASELHTMNISPDVACSLEQLNFLLDMDIEFGIRVEARMAMMRGENYEETEAKLQELYKTHRRSIMVENELWKRRFEKNEKERKQREEDLERRRKAEEEKKAREEARKRHEKEFREAEEKAKRERERAEKARKQAEEEMQREKERQKSEEAKREQKAKRDAEAKKKREDARERKRQQQREREEAANEEAYGGYGAQDARSNESRKQRRRGKEQTRGGSGARSKQSREYARTKSEREANKKSQAEQKRRERRARNEQRQAEERANAERQRQQKEEEAARQRQKANEAANGQEIDDEKIEKERQEAEAEFQSRERKKQLRDQKRRQAKEARMNERMGQMRAQARTELGDNFSSAYPQAAETLAKVFAEAEQTTMDSAMAEAFQTKGIPHIIKKLEGDPDITMRKLRRSQLATFHPSRPNGDEDAYKAANNVFEDYSRGNSESN